ncbi:MAG: hypothetical protein CVT99_04715 [Bacteroidetes bacterium HGW-Bacteroidetes-16]|jgi:putative flippase GtrA|nr:MAG: hypothetical protein CVT99_04715 [Bacteroidetes bacterium HGW-Bacteroidetes-16]
MNLRTIQRIENNVTIPRGKSLNLICSVLDLRLEDIIEHEVINTKKTLALRIINGGFLTILNFVLVVIFGYLIIDSEASINSKFGAILLSFFVPVFIVFKTLRMNRTERMLKFGLGLCIYTVVISTKISFPSLIITGLLPSLIIVLGTLFYGNELVRIKE